jgi:uncharacterized protein DUF2752
LIDDCLISRKISLSVGRHLRFWGSRRAEFADYYLRAIETGDHGGVFLRTFSVPERVGGFGLLVGVGAAVWPVLTDHTGASLPCPLRTLTGVPCPACGLTTAAVALVRGEVGAAFTANPLIFGLAALVVAVVPLVVFRAAGVLEPPRPWSPNRRRWVARLSGLLAVASWLFQLHRLGFDRAT